MNRSGSQNTLRSISNFGGENNSMLFENSLRSGHTGISNTMIRDKSPNRWKIQQLAEKLSNANLNPKKDKEMLEKEAMEQLTQIEQEIDNLHGNNEQEYKDIKEEARRIEELIDLERKEKAILAEKKRKEFKLIENSMEIEVNTEKFYSVKVDLAKEKKIRENNTYEFFDEVEENISDIRNDIDQLDKSRRENNDKLVKRLSQEINSFHHLLAEERKKRQNMHENIKKRVTQELVVPKTEKGETHETLLKLLEDICNCIEKTVLH